VKSTTLSSPDPSNDEGLRIALVAGSRLLSPEGYVSRGHFIQNDNENKDDDVKGGVEVKRGRSGSPTVDLRAAGNLN